MAMPEKNDTPKSPLTADHAQSKYCARNGRFNPSSSRRASTDSGVAWVPSMTTAGSPGRTDMTKKTSSDAATTLARKIRIRRTTYPSIR